MYHHVKTMYHHVKTMSPRVKTGKRGSFEVQSKQADEEAKAGLSDKPSEPANRARCEGRRNGETPLDFGPEK